MPAPEVPYETGQRAVKNTTPWQAAQNLSIGADNTEAPSSIVQRPRTTSHSLLQTSPKGVSTTKKGRFADVGTIDGNIERASISMPPPTNKPRSNSKSSKSRRPSAVFPTDEKTSISTKRENKHSNKTLDVGLMDDQGMVVVRARSQDGSALEARELLAQSDSTLSPKPGNTSNTGGTRLSFSSLSNLGVIYNGTSCGGSSAPSVASSTAGSVRNSGVDHIPAPYSALTPSNVSTRSAGSGKEAASLATTATDAVSVTSKSHAQNSGPLSPTRETSRMTPSEAARYLENYSSGPFSRTAPVPRRSRSRTKRRVSAGTTASSASPNAGEQVKSPTIGKIGVCALDVKARSKASRNILTRLQSSGEFEVILFGDKVILDEEVINWPICDFLIGFFSDGYPLDKAIAYTNLRKPFCINDLPMQKILWDRRICLRILDKMGVPTPQRLEVNRDGGPSLESPSLADHVYHLSGVRLDGPENGVGGGMKAPQEVTLVDDGDTLFVDGTTLRKPFVEKPVSGEDHNICIYFPKSLHGGGGRKLFRKIGNKSSEWDSKLITPRAITEEGSSYIYETFLNVDNAEDVKAYTIGPDFCHAETRKSPVVDGLVRRNTHGKEVRYITSLTKEESEMARKIANGFGQRICGFDLLRVGPKSYVIDVNGWSFVKDNNEYYDKCADILKQMFIREKNNCNITISASDSSVEGSADNPPQAIKNTSVHRSTLNKIFRSPSVPKLHIGHRQNVTASPESTPMISPPSIEKQHVTPLPSVKDDKHALAAPVASDAPRNSHDSSIVNLGQGTSVPVPLPASKHSWKLKGMVSVIRHADRTPKQKFKFTFHTQPFIDLLRGHQEEVLLKGEAALDSVLTAVKKAMQERLEDQEKLQLLRTSLARKGAWAGTKVQIKPMFRKRRAGEIGSEADASTSDVSSRSPETEKEGSTTSPEAPVDFAKTRSDSLTGVTLSRFSAAEDNLVLDKLQLIIKWGGEPTHSARYQSQDLGENMRNDLSLMNKEALNDVRVFTSSERRVSTSAQIWAASFLQRKDLPEDFCAVRKDLLDDSNAAKDVMDKVKKKLKLLLREGHKAPAQFAWPTNMPEPSIVVVKVAELMRFHRKVMRSNIKKLQNSAAASLTALNQSGDGTLSPNLPGALAQAQIMASIQSRWCCGEDPELFKERWEKLFTEFCDSEKIDPSKISELYDTMKFDSLHNRQFLEWVFTPDSSMIEEDVAGNPKTMENLDDQASSKSISLKDERKDSDGTPPGVVESSIEKPTGNNIAKRMGFRRKSTIPTHSPQSFPQEETQQSYFKLFGGTGQTKAKRDSRLEKLRELYQLAKVLFDFVCPQEYGIEDSEKLEIGLLTSLPLLKEIVRDLEEVQASDDAKSFIYFTKESHIYTLLNCILEGGIKTKIERNAIPELDYLSQICFELYEAEDKDADTFAYSIRISITPGCHTFDPLDVQLDSKHSISCAPKRSLTAHADWKEVIETLRAKFHTVKLPKSFLAINVSEPSANEWSETSTLIETDNTKT